MEEWKSIRLGDIVRIGSGLAYKADHLGSGDALLLGMGCVSFNEKFLKKGARLYSGISEERYIVSPGDIVLATRQQSDNLPILGMPAIIPEDYQGKRLIAGSNLYIVHNQSDIDNRFLYWLLKTPGYINHISSCKTGTTVRMITKKDVESFVFKCPPKEERERIADFLWSIEDKIDLNNRINHNLEEQAQALYKSWFVDFEPFKGGEFVRSELGMIPKDWKVLRFNEFATLSNERVNSESIPEFSITNNGIFPRDAKFNKQLSSSSLKNKIVRKGDLVFGMSRDILNWGVMDDLVGGVSSAYTIYRVNSSMMDGLYLKNFMNQHLSYFKDLIRPAAREGQSIDKGVLATKIVYRPSDTIWSSFLSIYLRIIDQEKLLRDETQKLIAFRDTILPELMEGRISISETC